ncbi:unnamed protein product [Cuscuta campestris]|uniref:RRM domain-containing protein n=1 Tax=Cuscuta campestris TaxID=132261 RepID=A0A484N2D6_9ASTE|nr:unnamed protein product [Cuscuta campestris]
MGRKRDQSRPVPYSTKRRRPLPPPPDDAASTAAAVDDLFPENPPASSKPPTTVVILGIPAECSVLDLKSRFEIYGAISRTRMDPAGLALITFRSRDSAESAVHAAFPITLHSKPVRVMWASDDPALQWRKEGVSKKEGKMEVLSKLVRAEVPLSRHGRGNKRMGSAIASPKDENIAKSYTSKKQGGIALRLGVPFKGRKLVTYDDIL